MQLLGPIMKSVVGNPPTFWEQNHLSQMKAYGNTNDFSNILLLSISELLWRLSNGLIKSIIFSPFSVSE